MHFRNRTPLGAGLGKVTNVEESKSDIVARRPCGKREPARETRRIALYRLR